MKQTPKKRNLALIESILEREIFNRTLQIYIESLKRPSKELVIKLMMDGELNLGEETIKRRSGTVLAWIDWIMELTKQS